MNKAIVFQFSEIGKKLKQKKENADNQCWLRLLIRFQYMSFVEVSISDMENFLENLEECSIY